MRSEDRLLRNPAGKPTTRFAVGIPMTGLLRSEWVMARYGQIVPTNFSMQDHVAFIDQWSPLNHSVADARNLIVHNVLERSVEWLFFLDHDVMIPPNTLVRLNEHMRSGKVPIVNGLYFTKSRPAEPLVYRGRGNSYFGDWKLGDQVWVDGCGMGCTLIHGSILREIYETSEPYLLQGQTIRRVYESVSETTYDAENKIVISKMGTEDLFFYDRLRNEEIFKRAGWAGIQRRRYPILVDTRILCKHIDWAGQTFPAPAELAEYLPGAPRRAGERVTWPDVTKLEKPRA